MKTVAPWSTLLLFSIRMPVPLGFVVKVSELLPVFPNVSLGARTPPFHMDQIYDLSHPHCPGDPQFLGSSALAPPNHCFAGIHPSDLRRIIGHEWWWPWESEVSS